MSTFTVSRTIQAPRTQVWSILADIGAIAEWNPGVVEPHLSSCNGRLHHLWVGAVYSNHTCKLKR